MIFLSVLKKFFLTGVGTFFAFLILPAAALAQPEMVQKIELYMGGKKYPSFEDYKRQNKAKTRENPSRADSQETEPKTSPESLWKKNVLSKILGKGDDGSKSSPEQKDKSQTYTVGEVEMPFSQDVSFPDSDKTKDKASSRTIAIKDLPDGTYRNPAYIKEVNRFENDKNRTDSKIHKPSE